MEYPDALFLPVFFQQKICDMHDFNAVVIADRKRVTADNVLVVVIPYFHKIIRLTGGLCRKLHADLYIDPFFPADSHKVDLLGAVLADINIVAPAFHFKIHHIFKHCRKHLSVKAHLTVSE